jgi:lipopolysaccharide export system permease protein
MAVKILHKYILREFLKILSMTTLSLIAIFLLVDVVENMDKLVEHGAPFSAGVTFFLYKAPFIFATISPVAVLLSVLLTLGLLSKHAEITAIKAGGVGILGVVFPLLVCGAVMSGAVIIMNEAVVPAANRRVAALETRYIKMKPAGTLGREGLWIRNPDGIYNILKPDLAKGVLHGVTYHRMAGNFELAGTVYAERAEWKDGAWRAEKTRRITFKSDDPSQPPTPVADASVGGYVFASLKAPDEFASLETDHELMSFMELYNYIDGLKDQGYSVTRYMVDLYGKLTFPLVNFIMVLVGIPFALRHSRRGGIADGVAVSVIIGFSFWVVFAVARSLGQAGAIPPLVAAVLPDLLFVAIGVYVFSYVRQ